MGLRNEKAREYAVSSHQCACPPSSDWSPSVSRGLCHASRVCACGCDEALAVPKDSSPEHQSLSGRIQFSRPSYHCE